MPRDVAAGQSPVFAFIAAKAGAAIAPGATMRFLTGGAVLRHYRLDFTIDRGPFAGPQSWVLRMDGATPLGLGLSRAHEFALQRFLYRAGLKVAEPLFICCNQSVMGAPFYLMRFIPGEARGAVVTAQPANPSLAARLARELAALHRQRRQQALHFLPRPPDDAAQARLEELTRFLAEDGDPHPVAEFALRWLRRHKPEPVALALCHGDFRTGNYLVDAGELAAVLDWDFAGWSDPDEDIAWFCAKAWRFAAAEREAGGIAGRGDFLRAYEEASGRDVDPTRLHYWEVMAALRWLVIALKQRDRFLRLGERSLDLALTGRRPAECELELLRLVDA